MTQDRSTFSANVNDGMDHVWEVGAVNAPLPTFASP